MRHIGDMSRVSTVVRVGCGLLIVLGGFLVVTGAIRLDDDRPGTAAPTARLAFGAVMLVVAVVVVLIASRRAPREISQRSTQLRAEAGAETVTCPSCGEANPPSKQSCHRCDQALR